MERLSRLAPHSRRPQAAGRDLRSAAVARAYGSWASVYDAVCAPIFRPAHRAAAAAANRAGGSVLEVGVGTGLLLPLYDRTLRVTGLDLSEGMLAKARLRLRDCPMPHVVALQAGDIHVFGQPPAIYDAIVMPFVLTLLEEPERALDNCRRMLRPGGEIIIVSHFRSEHHALAGLERWLAPRVAALGLRPDFPLARIADWAAGHADLAAPLVAPAGPFGVYKLVRIRRRPEEDLVGNRLPGPVRSGACSSPGTPQTPASASPCPRRSAPCG